MGLFSWSSKYDLSCPPIDEEHKRLFAIADKLHEALKAGQGRQTLKTLFRELIDYTCTHFRHEETIMRGCAYPNFAAHKVQHDALTARVLQLQKEFEDGKVTVTLETMHFLSDWLDQHICGTDRMVADHARAGLVKTPVRV